MVATMVGGGWLLDDRIDKRVAPLEQEVKELRVQVQRASETLANMDGKLNALNGRLDKRF